MSADTYKGESLQKKAARYTAHFAAKEWLRSENPGSWERGMHAFLCSREGGDVGVLRAMGVPLDNMLAIDRCESALQAARGKWSLVFGEQPKDHGPHFTRCDDAGEEIVWFRQCSARYAGANVRGCGEENCWIERWSQRSGFPCMVHAFLDFCGHLDKSTITSSLAAWRALQVGSVLTVAVLKGREKKQAVEPFRFAHARNRHQRRAEKATSPIGLHLIATMVRGETAWDIPRVLDQIDKENGSHSPTGNRWMAMMGALGASCLETQPVPLSLIEYRSETNNGPGVPMLIMGFAKAWRAEHQRDPLVYYKWNHEKATEWRAHVLKDSTVEDAALILNASKGTVRAWKAHQTMGSYGDA